jgi:hypothetical protein
MSRHAHSPEGQQENKAAANAGKFIDDQARSRSGQLGCASATKRHGLSWLLCVNNEPIARWNRVCEMHAQITRRSFELLTCNKRTLAKSGDSWGPYRSVPYINMVSANLQPF